MGLSSKIAWFVRYGLWNRHSTPLRASDADSELSELQRRLLLLKRRRRILGDCNPGCKDYCGCSDHQMKDIRVRIAELKAGIRRIAI